MKSVMISIRPKWCELIANGKKTIEVRKTKPKLETPFKCYIYCTKPSKAQQTVCGCMVLNDDELYRHPTQGIKHGDSIELMCRDDYTADNFLNGKVIGEFMCDRIYDIFAVNPLPTEARDYAIIGSNISLACLTLEELNGYLKGDDGYGWHITKLKIYDKPFNLPDDFGLTKPPQSWCYTEEV